MMQSRRLMFTLLLSMGGSAAHAGHVRDLRAYDLSFAPIDQLPARLGLGTDYTFIAGESIETVRGTRIVRMRQYFKQVPVLGYSIAVEQVGGGEVSKANGAMLQGIGEDLTSVLPQLDEAHALSALRNALPPSASKPRDGRAVLVVYSDDGRRARLAYLVSYQIDKPSPVRPMAIIDGNSGQIIRQWDGMAHAYTSAPAGTNSHPPKNDQPQEARSYLMPIVDARAGGVSTLTDGYMALAAGAGGNAKTGRYEYGWSYPSLSVTQKAYTCRLANAYVETYDMKEGSNPRRPVSFPCFFRYESFVNGAYAPANDAHHFAAVVLDMYLKWFGELPVPTPVVMKVSSNQSGYYTYWDGQAVHISDGDSDVYPAAALDLIAHEISHGFTRAHTKLFMHWGIKGRGPEREIPYAAARPKGSAAGVEEAFSDMAGEAAKLYVRGSNDFLVGAEVVKAKGGALRYMCEPTRDGSSIDNMKDYSSSLSPHQVAGVFNKAFCLLARTEGWDTRKAFETFYDANKVEWTPRDSAEDAACSVERAASNRGYLKVDVTAAFADVGVSCEADIELEDEVPVTGLSGVRRSVRNYKFQLPAGARDLRVSAYGGHGNADLYVKFGARPTATDWDCRPELVNNNEVCVFSGKPSAGMYYVQLRGAEAYSDLHLRAYWNR